MVLQENDPVQRSGKKTGTKPQPKAQQNPTWGTLNSKRKKVPTLGCLDP